MGGKIVFFIEEKKNFLSSYVPAILDFLADGLAKKDKIGLYLDFTTIFVVIDIATCPLIFGGA